MDTGELNSKRREKGRSTEQFEISESDCVCVLKNQMTYVIHFGPLWFPLVSEPDSQPEGGGGVWHSCIQRAAEIIMPE